MKLRSSLIALAAVAAAFGATGANAVEIYYQGGFSNDLWKYDTVAGTETFVGVMGMTADSTGLSFGANGTLYGYDRGSESLYTINTSNGATTLIGATGLGAEDFTIALDGSVGYLSANSNLYSVNLNDGVATLLGALGQNMDGLTTAKTAVNILGVDYAAGSIFGVDSNGIYAIGLGGGATFLGSSSGADETFDFGSDGTLYGHGDDGFLYTISLTDLAATQLHSTTSRLVFGMAVANGGGAVPEPGTWALMIGGFGLAGSMLRRRRTLAA